MPEPTPAELAADITYGRQVLEAELLAIHDLLPLVDERFGHVVQRLFDCRGRVVVTGVGKSGLIGQKISATLSSTGSPSLFLHSAEAAHGDMGRVLEEDEVLALSYSGSTEEVIRLVPLIKKIGAGLIAITSTDQTPLGKVADICLPIGELAEACPIGLVPTSSTTAMLALGDALAMTVAHRKSFDRESFALFHPGGSIGRQLVTVGEVMRGLAATYCVPPVTVVADAIREMSNPARPRSGAVLITDSDGRLLGIFTDGDLRRHVLDDPDLMAKPIADVMTSAPKHSRPGQLLADAYKTLKKHQIDELPVVDEDGRVAGLLDVQDVVEWGVAL